MRGFRVRVLGGAGSCWVAFGRSLFRWGVNRGGSGLAGVNAVAVWDGRDVALVLDVAVSGWGFWIGLEGGREEVWRCDDAFVCRRGVGFCVCLEGWDVGEAGALGFCCRCVRQGRSHCLVLDCDLVLRNGASVIGVGLFGLGWGFLVLWEEGAGEGRVWVELVL